MKRFLRTIVIVFTLLAVILASEKTQAAIDFSSIVGKYEFDIEKYVSVNDTYPNSDFGSQFGTYTPYLKITKNKKIQYYFGYEGGKGTCKLNGSVLNTKINNPNTGVVKEKMKVKVIGDITYIVQKLDGKKIYWKKV